MPRKQESDLPGHDITDADDILKIELPAGKVALLHSEYGVEGAFTNGLIMQAFLINLRKLSAYRNAPISVSVHELDPTL